MVCFSTGVLLRLALCADLTEYAMLKAIDVVLSYSVLYLMR